MNRLHFLDPERCLALLATAKVGRIAVIVNGVPQVVPVNYAVVDDAVVFRTGAGTKLAAAIAELPVSFEVDAVDEAAMTGWSVLLSGRAEVVEDRALLAHPAVTGLTVWAPGPKDVVVRVPATTISGRQLVTAD